MVYPHQVKPKHTHSDENSTREHRNSSYLLLVGLDILVPKVGRHDEVDDLKVDA